MKTHIALYLIIYILWGWMPEARAQESYTDRYNFTYMTMTHGLQCNFIDDLYKDSRGFLWISTAGGGVSRYDGYDFVHYTTNTPHCKLKSNFSRNTYEDRFGRLWITSESGTDIIDLSRRCLTQPSDPTGRLAKLLEQPAVRVMCDSKGCIWIGCSSAVHRIELTAEGHVNSIHTLAGIPVPGPDIALNDIDEDGNIWMGYGNEVRKLSIAGNNALKSTPIANCLTFESGRYISTLCSKENEVWIATDRGLYRYNRNGNVAKHYLHEARSPRSLSQNYLTSLAVTADKQLIIGTLRGANVYNPMTDDFDHIDNNQTEGECLLNSNFINCLMTDGDRIWLGTETGGVNKMEPRRLSIRNYTCNKENPYSLSCNPVNAIYEDVNGNLWVGTVEGGLNFKEKTSEQFKHYTTATGLSHNSVSALTADSENRLWVGSWGGGIDLIDLKAPHRVLRHISSQNTDQLAIDFVGTLIFDPINTGMWIGANQGIYYYDLKTNRVYAPLSNGGSDKLHGYIGSIIDKDGQLWIGCLEGVYVIDLHSRTTSSREGEFKFRQLHYKLDDPGSRIIEKITCFCQASDGTLWLGSNGYGIYKRTVDKEGKERFTAYTTEQGLSNNSVRGILEDKDGNLWISTNYGLSCYNPTRNHFSNYTAEDGLADSQFYWNASFRSGSGLLYFGGVSGLMAIENNPKPLQDIPVHVRLTRLRIGNEEILPDGKYIKEDIAVCSKLRLHEQDKSFSIEFSALNFDPRPTAVYSYRLVGFDNNWVNVPSSRRFASYTNLPPGDYTFQVKYTADGETDHASVTELKIVVKPFFYKTIWFTLFLTALVLVGVWQFYHWRIRSLTKQKALLHRTVQARTQELVEQKRLLENQTEELSRQNIVLTQQNEKITRQKGQLVQMSRKVQDATVDKLSFFTNITHEFRTPITLIIGPIERALKLSYNPQVIEQLQLVERNSKYLLSLINQLMDFRKVESGKMDIVKTSGNFLKFIESVVTPFDVFAGERGITIRRCYRLHPPYLLYDEEAMRKVVINLLSNAIKFTPNGGRVTIYISPMYRPESGKEELYICVSDTGNGIPEEDLVRIFNRFYQSHSNVKYPVYGQGGTGVGLYLCKRIVQMHGGRIAVQNNRTAGVSFRIHMPLQRTENSTGMEPVNEPLRLLNAGELAAHNAAMPEPTPGKLTILIVEDNPDMRGYIRSILKEQYNVVEAADGAEALSLLNSNPVDFIVSDLMMPVMDGIELSRRVKETFAISHIPFLMLTAKTSNEARLESYRMGVDEYLLKPFDETLLLARIHNILENRKRYQRKFSVEMNVDVLQMDEESSDKKFLNQIMEVVKEHYKNSYFEVGDFTEAMGVSKSLLNKKLQNLTGQSAGQFVRNYRLNIARELIQKNRETKNMNVSEIAYEVGFNDPKYFTRCFTKHFNVTPSSLLEQ